ncbi:degenerin-like protein asic-1 [Bombyx mandarina]|uniref:Degenerin-like protein asic-1 n=1 Tax=Bombyx mandarina TaxID=7092 RepID=A0A6J2JTY0_BOMMA|nr:degenerin-like protein asic-1 [Bombyx mandarina]
MPESSLKQKCRECVKGYNLLKTLVIVVCLGVVLQQISTCIQKLFVDIPITTYTHFDFNKTILYPSLTFCREPPYKFQKLLDHGLHAHPRFTSTWVSFNFSSITLDDLWDEITYTDDEMFVQYGLNGDPQNVELKPMLGFAMGRCYTMNPKILSTQATKTTGYSVTLRHSAEDVATSTSVHPPGYHVHVHYIREPYTEVEVYNGGLVDHLYVNVGETMDVKLKVDEYVMISSEDDLCTYDDHYSANVCTAQFVWDETGAEAGCSGPWMDSNLPRCDNFTSMRTLISAYIKSYNGHNCVVCPRFCRSYLYNTYVTARQSLYSWDSTGNQWKAKSGDATLQIQLYLYFNSMMVSVYEERYNYDWNLFLSDLGGSIGFLLGLSVIGIMDVLGKGWCLFIKPCFKKAKSQASNVPTVAEDSGKHAQCPTPNNWNGKTGE